MPDYTAHIANCLIGGESFTDIGNRRVRNRINLTFDGLRCHIRQDADCISRNYGDFVGQSLHATDMVIPDLADGDLQRAHDLARDVGEILSFATCSPVATFGYSYPAIPLHSAMRSVVGQVQYFRPTVETRQGRVIRQILERTWPTYRRLRTSRRLNIALDYYVLSHMPGHPVEVQLILTFVLLENLKHTFAEASGYPYIKGYFRNPGATMASPGDRKTFEGLLREMFAAVGMSPSLTAIKDLRNRLIHSGISRLDVDAGWTRFAGCQDLVREYLLRLLNYRGEYHVFSDLSIRTL